MILSTVLCVLLMLAEEPIVEVKIDLDITQTKIDNAEWNAFVLLSPQSETEVALVESIAYRNSGREYEPWQNCDKGQSIR